MTQLFKLLRQICIFIDQMIARDKFHTTLDDKNLTRLLLMLILKIHEPARQSMKTQDRNEFLAS